VSLIKCWDCKFEVSVSASICPRCGAPNPGIDPEQIGFSLGYYDGLTGSPHGESIRKWTSLSQGLMSNLFYLWSVTSAYRMGFKSHEDQQPGAEPPPLFQPHFGETLSFLTGESERVDLE
jgi:hypothetical protein